MKIICFGHGSIGRRHTANLAALGHHVVVADPFAVLPSDAISYCDWRRALADHLDADGAVVASPTDCHYDQLAALVQERIAVYVEKPVGLVREIDSLRELAELAAIIGAKVAVGFQYRWNDNMFKVRRLAQADGELHFYARDALLERYGSQVAEIIACHPFDTANWLFDLPLKVSIRSDGVHLSGYTVHCRGVAHYDCAMDGQRRESTIRVGARTVGMVASNDMYANALGAWLRWVETGRRDERTATLADGLAVMDILAQIEQVERV